MSDQQLVSNSAKIFIQVMNDFAKEGWKLVSTESQMYDASRLLAGTADAIFARGEELAIVDYKSMIGGYQGEQVDYKGAKRFNPNVIQLGLYKHLYEQNGGSVSHLFLVILSPGKDTWEHNIVPVELADAKTAADFFLEKKPVLAYAKFQLGNPVVCFDAKKHTYWINGVRAISCTQLERQERSGNKSKIPPKTKAVQQAMQRGRQIHKHFHTYS